MVSNDSARLVEAPKVGGKVSRCMIVNGNLKSCEPIIVDGIVNGDILCDDSVVIHKGGRVHGKIEASSILLEGHCEGPLEAKRVELTVGAQLVGYIVAYLVRVAGSVDGDILARELLEICSSGRVVAYEAISEKVVVKGYLRGEVTAKELLDIRTTATIEGDVQVKELRTEGSGKIFGAISRIEVEKNQSNMNKRVQRSEIDFEEEQTLQYG